MKVITYLAFTFLSILIQFCVMDYIQEKIQDPTNLNVTTQKQILSDLLKNISHKPHALYYRTHVISRSLKNTSPFKIYNNASMPEVSLGTTDATTTIFDVLYDENTSDSEATSTTTEMYSTSTEFDNITEITFFETKNKSSNVPNTTPKISFNIHCDCNLLYKVCDINCCCDQDCSDYEHKIFQCQETSKAENKAVDGCITHLFEEQRYGGSMLDNLFCVVKTNLPDKRNIRKYTQESIGTYYKWRSVDQKQPSYEFKKTLYKQADPIWLLKNGVIYYLDFPAPMINNYCTDRVPIAFLKEVKITCIVKLKDLEMLNILKTSEEAMIISATNNTFNSTVLNCTNLHCINWTILACENGVCLNYNKTFNEASCTEDVCTNIALKIDYDFYYYDLKIINATIKLHLQNISSVLPYMLQEVNVHFYVANKSIEHVIELSGNPGYIHGLPVIASYYKNNHTDNFFNSTSTRRRMFYPENRNGLCILSNTSNNIVKFGMNKRTKCRYVYPHTSLPKDNMCKNIQNDINELLSLNINISISPFGNPHDIADDNWINLIKDINKYYEPVYEEYNENTLKLYCYNLINRLSITFMFANVDEKSYTGQNKIISAKYEVTTKNISFNIEEDISIVITIDINFVDLTKPSIIEYAGSPHLNIHLPKDFFFPFSPNSCLHMSNTCIVTIYCCVILFFCK